MQFLVQQLRNNKPACCTFRQHDSGFPDGFPILLMRLWTRLLLSLRLLALRVNSFYGLKLHVASAWISRFSSESGAVGSRRWHPLEHGFAIVFLITLVGRAMSWHRPRARTES